MKNIVQIISLAKPLHGLIAVIGILIVVAAVIDLIVPILSKFIVDEIVAKLQQTGGSVEKLIFLIAIAFILSMVSLVVTTISARLGDHFSGRLRKFLTEQYYYKVLTLPQSYFDTELSGKIINQLSRGIQSIQQFINTATNFIIPTFLQSIFTIAVLAYYNLPIAFFTFLLFPTYLILSYYSSKQWGEEEVKKNKIEDQSRARIQEVITNISLVKSFITEKEEYSHISENLKKSSAIYARQSKVYHTFDFFRGFSLNIILTLINIVVFINTFQGKLSIGEMVLILQLVAQSRRPLFAMSFILTNIQNAEAGSKEFLEVLKLPSKEYFDEEIKIEKITNPSITFENVSFKYETSNQVLENISFHIANKEKVALVGHSGAGKTTIVNLLLKFYEPTKGRILLKDMDYKNLHPKFIRSNIALVFQESELFSSTVRENVMYGTKATEEEVINALKMANAYNFVMKLPKGLDSEIGERGVRLSGGQKQRIQIARAILKNAPILILDEATSSLDAKSEKEVHEALEHLMQDKLVIIIAHRFSTIQNVNKIIVIDKGRVVDCGSPQDLASRPGIYQDLLRYQIEGNKKLLEKFEIY
jgi:ATP-binding cassette subfamily B protein